MVTKYIRSVKTTAYMNPEYDSFVSNLPSIIFIQTFNRRSFVIVVETLIMAGDDFSVLRDLQAHLRTAQVPFEKLSTLAQQGDDKVNLNPDYR